MVTMCSIFFTPDACLEKEDWKWDDEQKCVVNPLGEDLAALEDIDGDYDFSTYGGPIEDTEGNCKTTPRAFSRHTLTHFQSAQELSLQMPCLPSQRLSTSMADNASINHYHQNEHASEDKASMHCEECATLLTC